MSDEVQRSLGRIEGTLDAINKNFALHITRVNDIEKRVGWIERKFNWAAGIVSGLYVGLVAYAKLRPDGGA